MMNRLRRLMFWSSPHVERTVTIGVVGRSVLEDARDHYHLKDGRLLHILADARERHQIIDARTRYIVTDGRTHYVLRKVER